MRPSVIHLAVVPIVRTGLHEPVPAPTTAPPPSPPTTGDPFQSPAGRFLLDPAGTLSDLAHEVLDFGARLGVLVGTWLGLATLVAVVVAVSRRRRRRHLAARGARMITIEAPPEVDPAGAEVLWSHLVELLHPRWRRWLDGQPHLCFEYRWSPAGLTIGLWVPGAVPPGLVERAIQGAWPGATTTTAPPLPPVPSDAGCEAGALRLARPEWFPLRSDHPTDSLRPLLAAATEVGANETAVVQVLARPVTGRRLGRAWRAAAAQRAGLPLGAGARLVHLFRRTVPPTLVASDPQRAEDARAIVAKAGRAHWEGVVRYAVAEVDTADRARRARLRGRAHGLASAFGVYGGHNQLRRHRLHPRVLAGRWFRRGDLLSVPELAALAHLPLDRTVPGLARAGARRVPPGPRIAASGIVVGDTDAGPPRPVGLDPADRRSHLHVLGATGAGKSTLLVNLICQDAEGGRGAVVIDPKGDLINDVLERLPSDLAGPVVLIDPDERGHGPTLNVLEGAEPELAVDHLVGIFRRIFEAYWGPRTDDVLRAACLTLLYSRAGATLADVPELLASERVRRPLVASLVDQPTLRGFWRWYDALGEAQQAQVTGPVMNKLRTFLLRRFVRDLIGHPTSSVDLGAVLDGGLCLVRVPKGIVGEETARLLGSLVVAKVWQATLARAKATPGRRLDGALYLDECHNFLTLPGSVADMLAEARGYGLSLVLAHQYLAQLPRDLREAMSANARTKCYFACSPEDARVLERHVAPELTAHDLAHLGAYQVACRPVVAGAEQPAFTFRARPAPPPVSGRAGQLRRAARAYGRQPASGSTAGALAGRRPPERAQISGVDPGLGSGVDSGVDPSSEPPTARESAGAGDAEGSFREADLWRDG